MSRQNRVTPFGELISVSGRGLAFGNRGALHDPAGRIRRRWAVRRWIVCRLEFRGRRRDLMQPGRYTELFFLDEATAWAAGHRPCAECRHADWRRFGDRWVEAVGPQRRADDIDAELHGQRLDQHTGRARTHTRAAEPLPDGVFVALDGLAWVLSGERLLRWTPDGYQGSRARPDGAMEVITPPALVSILRAGWTTEVPWLHPSAEAAAQLSAE